MSGKRRERKKVGTLQEPYNSLDSRCGERGGSQGVRNLAAEEVGGARPEGREASLGSLDLPTVHSRAVHSRRISAAVSLPCSEGEKTVVWFTKWPQGWDNEGRVRSQSRGKNNRLMWRESRQRLSDSGLGSGAGPDGLSLKCQGHPRGGVCSLIHACIHSSRESLIHFPFSE